MPGQYAQIICELEDFRIQVENGSSAEQKYQYISLRAPLTGGFQFEYCTEIPSLFSID